MKEECKKLREHLLSEVCVKMESESFVCADVLKGSLFAILIDKCVFWEGER